MENPKPYAVILSPRTIFIYKKKKTPKTETNSPETINFVIKKSEIN